jgi:hypothetical protein
MLLLFAHDRQQLLNEERRADVDGEEPVEILDRGLLDGCRLGDSGIGDEDVQPVANYRVDLLGELVCPVRRGKISGDSISTTAGLADLGDDRFGLFRAAAAVDENLRAHSGESQRAGSHARRP